MQQNTIHIPLPAAAIRALRLILALAQNHISFLALWLRHFGRLSLHSRALWMHHSCRRVARALQFSLHVTGAVPSSGIIVSNHLGYLDILAFASATPCIFVSRHDVTHWPIFGALARFGGTIFLRRDRRTAVDTASRQILAALQSGLPVVLFPEGTSTDGSQVLPFHPSLLEPAIRSGSAITAAAIAYQSSSRPESAFAYYGDVRFLPHLLAMLRVPHTRTLLQFRPSSRLFENRKQAAQFLHRHTVALRTALPTQSPTPA
jgi:1-acyl-sn-glycerol-3-phosphate acyltransferase